MFSALLRFIKMQRLPFTVIILILFCFVIFKAKLFFFFNFNVTFFGPHIETWTPTIQNTKCLFQKLIN